MDSENKDLRPLRRSTRQSSAVKALSYEPTPRGPLRRSKRVLDKPHPAAVNGSSHLENGPEDEEPSNKKSKLESPGTEDGSQDVLEAETDPERNDDQEMEMEMEMETEQGSSQSTCQPKPFLGAEDHIVDVNLSPFVVLGDLCKLSHRKPDNVDQVHMGTVTVKPPTKALSTLSKYAKEQRSSSANVRVVSVAEYNKKMEAKAQSVGTSGVNHRVLNKYPPSEESDTTRQRVNNLIGEKETVKPKKQAERKKKEPGPRKGTRKSSQGFTFYFCCLVFLLLLSAAALMTFNGVFLRPMDWLRRDAAPPSRSVAVETFSGLLSYLQGQFHSQRPDLWRRSRIHLEKHLNTTHPTEPVSLILTAGRSAERTLHCLAQGLASAFSSALNASVLQIDGASKASQQSDEVKLDIDRQLRAAFEGDRPAAVIHRLEELPPGSTLIFYRYCDHENAAYKQVFLLFTVLLPQEQIRGDLKDVEEMVQDYVKDRLVGASSRTSFDEMDVDKYGGLWSRISHLILPVVAEEEVEQKGC